MPNLSNLSLKFMLFFTILCIIFLLRYIIISDVNNNTDISEIDLLSEYNLSKNKLKNKNKKEDNLSDKFNIKEFDFINDNIIIHNKFKTELLDYQNDKCLVQSRIEQLQKEKELEFTKSFQKNIEAETKQHLINDILNIQEDIRSLKLLFKEDLNNIINDINENILTSEDKEQIIKIIISEIQKTKKQFLLQNQEQVNIQEHQKKNKLLQQKLNILEKKLKIYNQLFNTDTGNGK
jgi:hypothetical protein